MERALGRLAAGQQGVLTRSQARAAGLSDSTIAARIRSGRWERLHPGVYRVAGSVPSPKQALVAALMAHGSAAHQWGILGPPRRPAITVLRPRNPKVAGCEVHRSRDLETGRVRVWHSIACTDPLRTLVDLAQMLPAVALDEAVNAALATRLVTVAAIQAELARLSRPGRGGVGHLRRALQRRGLVGGPNPSVLESRGSAFLRRYAIPVLAAEQRAGPEGEFRVDFVLVPGIILELDGYVWHFSPEHKQRDEARRRRLLLDGNHVFIATWQDLRDNPRQLAHQLLQAVAQGGRG